VSSDFLKKAAYIFWGLTLVSIGILYIAHPEVFSSEYLVNFIKEFKNEMIIVYVIISLVRGFFLLPSTPFVLVGVLLFPENLLMVLVISMIGIVFSSTALYYFSDLLGFSSFLERKFPKKVAKWKKILSHPNAIFYVIGWSFFPFVPTDMICYVAGIIKMPYKNMMLGIFIGELVLVAAYVYFWNEIVNLF
jgi:uncharacterized membrane protein YdjX (TVP38/TMEM64 family)